MKADSVIDARGYRRTGPRSSSSKRSQKVPASLYSVYLTVRRRGGGYESPSIGWNIIQNLPSKVTAHARLTL